MPLLKPLALVLAAPDLFAMTQEFTTEQKGKSHAGSMAMTYKRVGECK
jgi:hypothetical protein